MTILMTVGKKGRKNNLTDSHKKTATVTGCSFVFNVLNIEILYHRFQRGAKRMFNFVVWHKSDYSFLSLKEKNNKTSLQRYLIEKQMLVTKMYFFLL